MKAWEALACGFGCQRNPTATRAENPSPSRGITRRVSTEIFEITTWIITWIWGILMLHYAAVFLVIAIIAAVFGFGGIAAGAAGIAKILFVVFLIGAVVAFLLGPRRV
jgi:uncharacterized membrane protein YtjA (UPF0391 family)